MSNKCDKKDCINSGSDTSGNIFCIRHSIAFKEMCKKNNYCVRCTFENSGQPIHLSKDGMFCPICDYDEYNVTEKK